jgi:hypothetical protein
VPNSQTSTFKRQHAVLWHAVFSLLVFFAVGALVFLVWYPKAYRLAAGGTTLFLIICTVDVILGPLLMGVVFNPKKSKRMLVFDIAVIVSVQLAALGYGLYTVAMARPLGLVAEVDRFRIVSAVDVRPEETNPLKLQLPAVFSLQGPVVLGTRKIEAKENFDVTSMAIGGFDVGQRPSFWVPYTKNQHELYSKAAPLKPAFEKSTPETQTLILNLLGARKTQLDNFKIAPLIAKDPSWSVLLDEQGEVVGLVPIG